MAINILMPALSPTMTEGKLAKWHVTEGDRVEPGQVICEIETDKATMEVEAVDEGTIGKLLVPEGTETLTILLSVPGNGTILDGTAVVTITDDDLGVGQAPALPVPALSPTTLALLAAMLAMFGLVAARRRREV